MRCDVCGRQVQNEEANFCEYCGSSFRERKQSSYHMPQKEQSNYNGFGTMPAGMQMQQPNQMNGFPHSMEQERPISFLNWLGSYAIFFVPVVGWLVFIIMLFIWSFSSNTPASKKNWARATLIFVTVFAIVIIAYFAFTMMPIIQEMYQQMEAGTYDPNTFYQELMDKYY